MTLNTTMLKDEIGEDNYQKLISLPDKVNYSSFDNTINKFQSEDETSWGLAAQELKDIKVITDIAKLDGGVKGNLWMKLLMVGNTTSVETIIEKKIIWQNRDDKTYIILKSISGCFLLN